MKTLSDDQRKYLEQFGPLNAKSFPFDLYKHLRFRQTNEFKFTEIDALQTTGKIVSHIKSILKNGEYSADDAELLNVYLRDFMKNKFGKNKKK